MCPYVFCVHFHCQVRDADFRNDAYLKDLGMTVDTRMVEVTGRVLPAPTLKYKGGQVWWETICQFSCFLILA